MKNWKRNKKWMRRLWNAMAFYETQNVLTGMECYFTPAKKPISGKTARQLVGSMYRVLDAYEGGWLFSERPKFCKGARYIILAESEDGQPETLRICRAEENYF